MESRDRRPAIRRDRSKPEHARDEFWDRLAGGSESERVPDPYAENRGFHASDYADEEPQAVLGEMIETGWTVSDALIAEAANETGQVDEQYLRDMRDQALDRLVQSGWASPRQWGTPIDLGIETHRDEATMSRDEWDDCVGGVNEEAAVIAGRQSAAAGRERDE